MDWVGGGRDLRTFLDPEQHEALPEILESRLKKAKLSEMFFCHNGARGGFFLFWNLFEHVFFRIHVLGPCVCVLA